METCKSGSEGGCRKPVAYAIRRLCPTLRSAAELYGNNHACELRVCRTAEAGKHGQRKDGRGHRRIGSTAALRHQYPERYGADQMRKRGHPL